MTYDKAANLTDYGQDVTTQNGYSFINWVDNNSDINYIETQIV